MKVVQTQILNLSNNASSVSREQINIPYILKDKILLSPGEWNGLLFKKEQIELAFKNTDWTNKENFALIYDHDPRASNWLGNVINIHLSEDGSVLGDLELFDEDLINKLVLGKAKLGISARVLGSENDFGEFEDFTFNNFSVVYEPACKNAYINLSKSNNLEKLNEIFNYLKTSIELVGETTSQVSSGDKIDNNYTNQKTKYKKKKDSSLEEDEDEEEEVLESLSENSNIDERGLNTIEKEMAENEIIEKESKVLEETKELVESKDLSQELSLKLDEVILSLKKLSESITELNSKKVELEESPKEETPEESSEESEELSQLKKEVQELKANQKVALSEPNIVELEKPKRNNMLLGRELSPAENRLKEVLLKNSFHSN